LEPWAKKTFNDVTLQPITTWTPPRVAPAVAPHQVVHLIEPAAVSPVPQRVGGGAFKTPIVLEAVWDDDWDRGATVASQLATDETENDGDSPQDRCRGRAGTPHYMTS
jgi:hypothetical protein